MIDVERMYECERNFPARFTNVAERPYGRLFFNPDNPLSYDSNHALVLNLGADLDGALEDILHFYRSLQLPPRIYPAFIPNEWPILEPVLKRHGFQCEECIDRYFHLSGPSTIQPVAIEIRRVREVDDSIAEVLCAGQGSDRTVRILHRHLQSDDFHLLAGYRDGRAVTLGSCEIVQDMARVDNVLTHPAHRNQGYGRALIHEMVRRYPSVATVPLYLWATDPTAIRIYIEAGFTEFKTNRPAWGAWSA